ncbi:Ankyrin repeat family protein, putative [Theobroma cacao]|uniref:Ankyrin repeat family protein, putative n=1 Tax=Theobroma cacao TaxID=3641 RepID=A0A061F5T8_THECC|nr:Ankyrin repeat family protein, putative [Theobroma cacao]
MDEQVNLKLFSAARSGNLQTLRRLIQDDEAKVHDKKTPEGNTVLHFAARFGHKSLVEELITRCPSLVHQSNFKGETPLHVAAKAGRHDIVESLMDSKTDKSGLCLGWIRDNSGNTPLHGAVRNEHSKVVKAFAKKDPLSLRWLNDAGESPLSIAIDMRFTKLAATIIDLNKSTLDYRGNDDQTPLHCAVIRQDFGELLKDSPFTTLLHSPLRNIVNPTIFLCFFLLDIMTEIINLKKDLVGEQDGRGRTPLHYAAALGHQKMVEVLINENPWVAYKKDKNQKIPLHLAAGNGKTRLIEALLQPCPETIEIVDKMQQNILHIAAKNGNVDAVSYILKLPEMEDLVNSPDKDGNTPLHLAARNYHSDVVSVLSKNLKVEIRAINHSKETAIAIVKLPDDRGMELQKHLTLKALKSAYKQKAIHLEDATELDYGEVEKDEKPDKDEKSNKDGKKSREMAQIISVMSTLIATFTFTAAFTIPGGFENDGPDKGLATLISKSAFQAFVISDAVAMTSSITAAVIVFWSSSRRDTESFLDTLPFAIALTWISLMAMALAFVTGLFVVLQKTLWLAILVCIIGCAPPFILYIFSPIFLIVFVDCLAKGRGDEIDSMCSSDMIREEIRAD